MPYVFASSPNRTYYKTNYLSNVSFTKSANSTMYATYDFGRQVNLTSIYISDTYGGYWDSEYNTSSEQYEDVWETWEPPVHIYISNNNSTWTLLAPKIYKGTTFSSGVACRYVKVQNEMGDSSFSFSSTLNAHYTVTGSSSNYTYYVDTFNAYAAKISGSNYRVEVK